MLDKNKLLGRDEKGNLIPAEIDIPELDGKVMIIPVTKGELERVQAKYIADPEKTEAIDIEMIVSHLIKPKISIEEFSDMPVMHMRYLLNALLEASGVPITKDDDANSAIAQAEAELAKN